MGGHLALHLACAQGNAPSVSELVDANPTVCSLPDRRGDLPVALLAAVAGQRPSSVDMKTALAKLREAYTEGLHMHDHHHKAPVDYCILPELHDEVKILSPRIKLDPLHVKKTFPKLLYSNFNREDTIKNYQQLVHDYNYVPPFIDTMFHSRPWKKPTKCASVPIYTTAKVPHRPKTPLIRRTFDWYQKDACNLVGRDFHGRCRNFDKTTIPPSPRLRRLVQQDLKNRKKSIREIVEGRKESP